MDTDALRGGEEWRAVIYHWLSDCDAAVILLGPSALASPWVRREVNILLWRAALGSPITIIPVLLGSTSSTDVRTSGLSELEPLQFVRADTTAPDEAQIEAVTARILERLAPARAFLEDTSPMSEWLESVKWCLGKVDDERVLANAVEILGGERWTSPSLVEARRFASDLLLARPFDQNSGDAIRRLADRMDSESIDRLLGFVAPNWVSGEAARVLVAPRDRRKAVLALVDAHRPRTGGCYVQRAACCSRKYQVVDVGAVDGEDGERELTEDMEDAVRSLLGIGSMDAPTEGVGPDESEVLFLSVYRASAPIEPVLATVRAFQGRYPWLNVIVLTNSADPPGPAVDVDDAVVVEAPGIRDEVNALARLARLQYAIARPERARAR